LKAKKMPLKPGNDPDTISANIAELIDSGYSREEASAIAYRNAEDQGTQRAYDINGWFEVKRNPISKTGIFPYRGSTIGADDPNRIYMVLRPEEELSHPDCIESFKLLPWIDDHAMLGPVAQELTDQAMPAEAKGIGGVIGENVFFEDGTLWGNIKVFSETMARLIEGGKRELSAGYRCIYDQTPGVFNGQTYDAVQRTIRGNHLALVTEGRCGPEVAVLDHLTITFDAKDIEMAEKVEPAEAEGSKSEGGMTLEECVAMVKTIAPQLAELQALVGAIQKAEVAEGHTDIPEPAEDKQPESAAAEPEEAPKAPVAAMDAAEITRRAVKEIGQRNALADSLSWHVGTFDHSEMTVTDVAKYGVEKLGIPCTDGAEVVAVQAFLHGRAKPQMTVDAADRISKGGAISELLNGKE
jgi:uncharacterized protein